MDDADRPQPFAAAYRPVILDLKPGTYEWCACGLSDEQPWCDGRSHNQTPFEPLTFTLTEQQRVLLCRCKQSGSPPFCDGTHGKLRD